MKQDNQPSDASLQNLIDQFWETFPPVWNRIRSHVQAVAAEEFGITVEQFHVLRHIRKGAASVSDLAQVKQTSRSATSQAVETLVSKGLIERKQESKDRRCIHLNLTPAGNELLNAIFRSNRAWMMEKLNILSPDQIQPIIQALRLLREAFSSDQVEQNNS